ncbi:DNA repair protein [Escherichia coli]|nr:DNA repair protein [Escherichia coli]
MYIQVSMVLRVYHSVLHSYFYHSKNSLYAFACLAKAYSILVELRHQQIITVCAYSDYLRCIMGFPSPAQDCIKEHISIDKRIISRPAATYFMKTGATHYREGILSGALFVVDASLNPCDGSLLVCATDGEFRIKRYLTYPQPHLENLDNGKRERIPDKN